MNNAQKKNAKFASMEYVIYCDESLGKGQYYSDFFGGALVKSCDFEPAKAALEALKTELNLKGEIKWVKVTENYLQKYMDMMGLFFSLIEQGKIKVRIMFRDTAKNPSDLTRDKINNRYSILYYQFVKNAFGLCHRDKEDGEKVYLKIFFDEIPYPLEQRDAFKSHIFSLQKFWQFRKAGIKIRMDDLAEINSGKHVVQQCMDIVLGSMAFMLNKHNLEIPEGATERGKRTIAKEKLFCHILGLIRNLKDFENFQICCDTPASSPLDYWQHPYRHWEFQPSEFCK